MASQAMPIESVFDRVRTISRAMDEVLRAERPTEREGTNVVHWLPSIDVYQADDALVVEADLPGVREEDVEVGYERHVLTLRGVREHPRVDERQRVFTAERLHGQFMRAIRLPDWVDAERAEANFADGVLRVRFPRAASAQPRRITITPPAERVAEIGATQTPDGAERPHSDN